MNIIFLEKILSDNILVTLKDWQASARQSSHYEESNQTSPSTTSEQGPITNLLSVSLLNSCMHVCSLQIPRGKHLIGQKPRSRWLKHPACQELWWITHWEERKTIWLLKQDTHNYLTISTESAEFLMASKSVSVRISRQYIKACIMHACSREV